MGTNKTLRLWEMSNYQTAQTRLPCDIYVSQKGAGFPGEGSSPHSARIKVFSGEHGEPDVSVEFDRDATTFTWRDTFEEVESFERQQIEEFIAQNREILLDIWDKKLPDNVLLQRGRRFREWKIDWRRMGLRFPVSVFARATADMSRPFIEVRADYPIKVSIKSPFMSMDDLPEDAITTTQTWLRLNRDVLLKLWTTADSDLVSTLRPLS